jgi:hypothetical protein
MQAQLNYNGYIDGASCSGIGGWAWDGINADRIDVTLFTSEAPYPYQSLVPLTTVSPNL